jgi:hypothetical protein
MENEKDDKQAYLSVTGPNASYSGVPGRGSSTLTLAVACLDGDDSINGLVRCRKREHTSSHPKRLR